MSGQSIGYTIQDNGPLDLNPEKGVIEDPVSVASAPAQPVPLPAWLLVMLGCATGWLGLRSLRGKLSAT